ncbi:hypothetical protein [Phyllobacterium brassicacearum]|uniref:hypothetical protein n=1 Tax=Phyllobacterium brassicacearum TaxID=314235 RepID=UPI001414D3D3|nr:hypothetical protein [Phyllobacterium brassicacearum]
MACDEISAREQIFKDAPFAGLHLDVTAMPGDSGLFLPSTSISVGFDRHRSPPPK